MSDDPETVGLLREIRDLQRAHLERYQEFTADVVKRQDEVLERQRQTGDRARQADQLYRQQVLEHMDQVRRSQRRTSVIVWISVLLQTALVLALGLIILALFKAVLLKR